MENVPMNDEKPLLLTPAMSPDEVRKHTKISEDFYTVYCNHIRVAMSQIDFRLFVGENYPTATGELTIIENLGIVMSPQQAKATLELLAGLVAAYEKNFGPIKPLTVFPAQSVSTESPPPQPPNQKPS